MKRKKIDTVDRVTKSQVHTSLFYDGQVCVMQTEQADGFEKLIRIVGQDNSVLWEIRR